MEIYLLFLHAPPSSTDDIGKTSERGFNITYIYQTRYDACIYAEDNTS